MHIQRTNWTILATLLALALLAALAVPALAEENCPPVGPQHSRAFQEADPADKVRAELENRGYTVLEVGTSDDDAMAGAIMEIASFEFDEKVRYQIVHGWYALSKAYTDPGIKVYLTGLVYQNRYLLCFMVTPADFSDWIARRLSDQAFAGKYVFKVWDQQTGQWVMDKDFLHKSFGVPVGKTGPEAVGPLPKPMEGSPRLVFEDDFSDPNSGWDTEKKTDYSYGYVDGEYSCRGEKENHMIYATYPDLEFDDFIYQVECRQVEGDPENEYGLIFRFANQDYYKFGITGEGRYNLSLRKGGEWTKVVDWTQSTAIKRGDQTNVLKVVCAGQDISLYINDEHVKTVQDAGLSKGRIGLFVGGWENMPTEARFDNVKVWTSGPGPAPDDWTDSARGSPASTRYNPTALTLPLQLLWEWGDADTGRPDALVALGVGDRRYVLTDRGALYVLDAAGRELAHTTIWAEGGNGPGTLVATGDSVIASVSRWVSGRHPEYPAHVVGLDRDGQRQWELEVPGDQGPCYLLADQGLVAVAPASSGLESNWLSVRDAATGEERWRKTTEPGGHLRPLASDGVALYVAGPGLVAYDWRTGQERWQQTDERVRGVQFAAVDQGRLYALVVAGPAWALDTASGQILWQSPFGNVASLAVGQDHVYVAQGMGGPLHALDSGSGAATWQWQVPEGEDVTYVAACQTHVLAVTNRPGAGQQASTLYLLDPATGAEQGRVPLTWWEPRPLSGGLAVAGDQLYAASDHLRAYGTGPGQ